MCRNEIHQGRRQTVVRLEAEFAEACAHCAHLSWIAAAFDDGRYKGGEFGWRPAGLRRQLGVYEVEPVERVLRILDSAVHMNTAFFTGVSLNCRIRIHHGELIRIGSYAQLVARDNRHHRE